MEINNSLFYLLIIQSMIHLQGVIIAIMNSESGKWNANSTFIDTYFSGKYKKQVCFVVHLGAALVFFSAALSYEAIFIPGSIWLDLLLTAAALSFIALDVFPKAIGFFGNRLIVIIFNVLILVSYFYLHSGIPFYA